MIEHKTDLVKPAEDIDFNLHLENLLRLLRNNKQSLLKTGLPSEIENNYFLDHISLYPFKLPRIIVVRSAKNLEKVFDVEYSWDAPPCRDFKELEIERLPYEKHPEISGFVAEEIDLITRMRERLFDLKMAIISSFIYGGVDFVDAFVEAFNEEGGREDLRALCKIEARFENPSEDMIPVSDFIPTSESIPLRTFHPRPPAFFPLGGVIGLIKKMLPEQNIIAKAEKALSIRQAVVSISKQSIQGFINHQYYNEKTLIETGLPSTYHIVNPMLEPLTNLYPVKLPDYIEAWGNTSGCLFSLIYSWDKDAERSYNDYPAYVYPDYMGFSRKDIEMAVQIRQKVFNLKNAILEILAGTSPPQWEQCLEVFRQQLNYEEFLAINTLEKKPPYIEKKNILDGMIYAELMRNPKKALCLPSSDFQSIRNGDQSVTIPLTWSLSDRDSYYFPFRPGGVTALIKIVSIFWKKSEDECIEEIFTYLSKNEGELPPSTEIPLSEDQVKKGLTPKRVADYETHEYRCYDQVEIVRKKGEGTKVRINGKKIRLTNAEIIMFLDLREAAKTPPGWWREKLDSGDAKYSLIKSIRQKASPVLFNQNPGDFIENKQAKKGGKSRYRISVHHDFIHEVDK